MHEEDWSIDCIAKIGYWKNEPKTVILSVPALSWKNDYPPQAKIHLSWVLTKTAISWKTIREAIA